jgi:ABC-type glycerol-3-phosphate transport system substrate-binding protein
MMPTNAGSWFKEDGSLEPEALKSYLKSLRRFSDSVNSLVDEEDTYMSDMHEMLMNEDIQQYLTYSNLSGSDVSWEAVNVASGGVQVALGNLAGTEGLQYIYSAQKKGSSIDFASMPGSIDNVFVPIGVVGVNAKSDDVETAKTFVDYLISEEGQKSMTMNSGFPINKAAFDKAMEDPNKGNPGYKEGDSVGSAGMTDGNGKELEIELYWPDQTFIDNFKTRLSEMDTPAYNDDMILTTIMKDCMYYVMGDGEVDTVVDQVVKDISIYLSE